MQDSRLTKDLLGAPADSVWTKEQELQFKKVVGWIPQHIIIIPVVPGKVPFEISPLLKRQLSAKATAVPAYSLLFFRSLL